MKISLLGGIITIQSLTSIIVINAIIIDGFWNAKWIFRSQIIPTMVTVAIHFTGNVIAAGAMINIETMVVTDIVRDTSLVLRKVIIIVQVCYVRTMRVVAEFTYVRWTYIRLLWCIQCESIKESHVRFTLRVFTAFRHNIHWSSWTIEIVETTMPKNQVIATLIREQIDKKTHNRIVHKRVRPRVYVEKSRKEVDHRAKEIPNRADVRECFRANILLTTIESEA